MKQNQLCIDVSAMTKHTSERLRELFPEAQTPSGFAATESADTDAAPIISLPVDFATSKNIHVNFDVSDLVPNVAFATGTSAYAIGQGGLELARIELARTGILSADIFKLTAADVSFEYVTLAFMLQLTDGKEAAKIAKEMTQHARVLGLKIIQKSISYRNTYSATEERSALADYVPAGLTVSSVREPEYNMIKLEVFLPKEYLTKNGLLTLNSWQSAHADNRYPKIFKETVRRLFCLDSSVDLQEPGQDIYDRVFLEEQQILRGYIKGKQLTTLLRKHLSSTAQKKTELKKRRESIFEKVGYDINIPWSNFKSKTPVSLGCVLQYAGDYEPILHADQPYFCKATWPNWHSHLRQNFYDLAS